MIMKKTLLTLALLWSVAYGQFCADEDTVRSNSATQITATTARINGTTSHFTGAVVSLQLKYVRVGQTDTVTSSGTGALRNLTGLQPATQYVYYYKSICGSGSQSQTIGPYRFTTLANTILYVDERPTRFYHWKADSSMIVAQGDTVVGREPSTFPQIRYKTSDNTFYGYYPNCSCWRALAIDSAGIIGLLDGKVDSVTVSGDSLFYWKVGVSYGYILHALANTWQQTLTAGSTLNISNNINSGNNTQSFSWPTLGGGNLGMYISSESSTAATGGEILLQVTTTHTPVATGITTYSADIQNSSIGTNLTNIALMAGATEGATNIAAWFNRGKVRFGTSGTESGILDIVGATSGTITFQPQSAAGTYNWNWPTTAGTSGYLLTSGGGGSTAMTWTDPSTLGGITIDSTTITSGTNTRILYNNSGVVGEYSVTGTGTTAVLSTSPSFTTSIVTPVVNGSTSSAGSLSLQSTTNATKGKIITPSHTLTIDEANQRVAINHPTDSPGDAFEIWNAAGTGYMKFAFPSPAPEVTSFTDFYFKSADENKIYMGKASSIFFTLDGPASSVGIGTTGPSAQLHTTGTVRFANFGAGTATFDASGNISSVSDVRLKNVQGYYNSGLKDLMKINPIVYKWKPETKLDSLNSYIGFSAQNIEYALGENAVGINRDGYKSIQERAILAALTNSIKELKDLNDSQQKEIDDLKKEVKKLKRL